MDTLDLYDGLKKKSNELNYLKLNNQSKTITQALDKLIKFLCLHIKSQIDSERTLSKFLILGLGSYQKKRLKTIVTFLI